MLDIAFMYRLNEREFIGAWRNPFFRSGTRERMMLRTLADAADTAWQGFVSIKGLRGDDAVSLRLRELGFAAGSRVRFVRKAPLGDPAIFELHGVQMGLRRSEARRILIRQKSP